MGRYGKGVAVFEYKGVMIRSISLFVDKDEFKILAGEPITVNLEDMVAEYRGMCFDADPSEYRIIN
jgi:hypothetical protein